MNRILPQVIRNYECNARCFSIWHTGSQCADGPMGAMLIYMVDPTLTACSMDVLGTHTELASHRTPVKIRSKINNRNFGALSNFPLFRGLGRHRGQSARPCPPASKTLVNPAKSTVHGLGIEVYFAGICDLARR